MRHRVEGKKLSRDMDHRKALLKNLAISLIDKERIETTLAKAKYVKPYIEKLITRAKRGSDFNNVKFLMSKIQNEAAVRKLLGDLAERFKETNGGYTKITLLPEREGDKAKMGKLEFVAKQVEKKEKKK